MDPTDERELPLDNECIDRISQLPDEILGQILSHLSLEKAAATSVLSIGFRMGDYLLHALCFPSFQQRLADFLHEFSDISRLYLSASSIKVLHRSSVRLPTFDSLTCLALGKVEIEGWTVLACLLCCTPKLEVLKLEEGFDYKRMYQYKGMCYPLFMSSMQSPPVCLKLHLKKIELWKFGDEEDEIKFIEYLLEFGGVLEEVVLPCSYITFDRLSIYPKLSQKCQILPMEKLPWSRTPYARFKWRE